MSAELMLVMIFAVSLLVTMLFLRKTKASRSASLAEDKATISRMRK
jgi:hypothetical protein